MEATYLLAINAKFSKKAAELEDANVPLLQAIDLPGVFCFQEPPIVSRDCRLRFYCTRFPPPACHPRPADQVIVRKWLDGSLYFYRKNKPLSNFIRYEGFLLTIRKFPDTTIIS